MKRFISVTLFALLIASALWAQSISETTGTPAETPAAEDFAAVVLPSGPTVDLTTGTSTSELVAAAFNKDGNLEVTYEGTEPIEITLSGTLEGTLIVKSDNADYTLILNNVMITGKTLPAIQLKSTTTATIYMPDGTTSVIADSPENTKKGAITSSGSIVFAGSPKAILEIDVYKKHGVKTDGGVTVDSGYIYIHGDENAEGNMVSADLFFIMNGGELDILAEGNVHATESKGIKVNGVEGTGKGQGQVEINDGVLIIESVGKALSAGWKLSEDATTETTEDDPAPNVYINGGYVIIKTTGTPYEISDDESLSPEGIEAKDNLIINDGYVYVESSDDALNAGKSVVINGGYVYALATDNDSIDSNGKIEINGGMVICISSSREQAFDCDNDANFKYTGGIYVGAGNGNNMPKAEGTTGYSIAYGNRTFYAGDQIAVLDSEGNVVIGFVVPFAVDSLSSIVFGTEDFVPGASYTIALGAFEEAPEDGLVDESGTAFKTKEQVVTMDMTANTVSEGYIGMNVGGGMGMGGFGDFGRQNTGMQRGMQGGFAGQQQGTAGGNFTRPDNGMQQGMQQIPQGGDFTVPQTAATLPEGVVLPENFSSENAMQLIQYLLANYGAMQQMQQGFPGGEPGQIPQGQMPGGQMPGGMTPPQAP
ncbi:MAG: carbohydrate-binding domain-containing protein [Spirochaetales bacterium]|nr:carbohydrate-binding domain-containing protein [Spirochaetales bacterium]